MKTFWTAVLFLSLIILVVGCDKDPSFPSAPISGLITLRNFSTRDVAIFRYRPAGTDQWGINVLAEPIPSGNPATYYMPPGSFDIRLEDANATVFWTFNNISITQDQNTNLDFTD